MYRLSLFLAKSGADWKKSRSHQSIVIESSFVRTPTADRTWRDLTVSMRRLRSERTELYFSNPCASCLHTCPIRSRDDQRAGWSIASVIFRRCQNSRIPKYISGLFLSESIDHLQIVARGTVPITVPITAPRVVPRVVPRTVRLLSLEKGHVATPVSLRSSVPH